MLSRYDKSEDEISLPNSADENKANNSAADENEGNNSVADENEANDSAAEENEADDSATDKNEANDTATDETEANDSSSDRSAADENESIGCIDLTSEEGDMAEQMGLTLDEIGNVDTPYKRVLTDLHIRYPDVYAAAVKDIMSTEADIGKLFL